MQFARASIRAGSGGSIPIEQIFNFDNIVEMLVENFEIFKTYYAIVEHFPKDIPFMLGKEIFLYTTVMLVPRFIWPGKPQPAIYEVISKAVNGSYTMEVNNIATAQYLTGSKISASSGSTKMVDLDSSLLNKEIEVKVDGKTTKFTITEDTTIDNFTSELKKAGLNASFDTAQKRLFISSKDSGLANAFSITTSGVSDAEVTARKNLRDAVGYDLSLIHI